MKTEIDRTNRDRRGGHEPSPVLGDWGGVRHVKAKVFFKKLDKKRLRREAKRITEQGVNEFYHDNWLNISDHLADLYLDEQEWLDELSDIIESESEEFFFTDEGYDFFDDSYDEGDWEWSDHDMYHEGPFQSKSSVIETVSETLNTLLHEDLPLHLTLKISDALHLMKTSL